MAELWLNGGFWFMFVRWGKCFFLKTCRMALGSQFEDYVFFGKLEVSWSLEPTFVQSIQKKLEYIVWYVDACSKLLNFRDYPALFMFHACSASFMKSPIFTNGPPPPQKKKRFARHHGQAECHRRVELCRFFLGKFQVTWMGQHMDVSENNGTPQIIHFSRVFHYKPSILGYHYFWKHPYLETLSQDAGSWPNADLAWASPNIFRWLFPLDPVLLNICSLGTWNFGAGRSTEALGRAPSEAVEKELPKVQLVFRWLVVGKLGEAELTRQGFFMHIFRS